MPSVLLAYHLRLPAWYVPSLPPELRFRAVQHIQRLRLRWPAAFRLKDGAVRRGALVVTFEESQ